MGKSTHDDVFDAMLDYMANNATRLTVCSSVEPTTFAEADSTYWLADVTIDSGDFTIANGDTSGRKVTIGAQNNVDVDNSGNANHITLLDVANSKLLYVTTCTNKAISTGDQVNVPAWDIEIADPS